MEYDKIGCHRNFGVALLVGWADMLMFDLGLRHDQDAAAEAHDAALWASWCDKQHDMWDFIPPRLEDLLALTRSDN